MGGVWTGKLHNRSRRAAAVRNRTPQAGLLKTHCSCSADSPGAHLHHAQRQHSTDAVLQREHLLPVACIQPSPNHAQYNVQQGHASKEFDVRQHHSWQIPCKCKTSLDPPPKTCKILEKRSCTVFPTLPGIFQNAQILYQRSIGKQSFQPLYIMEHAQLHIRRMADLLLQDNSWLAAIWSVARTEHDRIRTCRVFPCGLAAYSGGRQLIIADDKPQVVHASVLDSDCLLPAEGHGVIVFKVNVQHLGPAIVLLL